MHEAILIQLSREELVELINKAVNKALGQQQGKQDKSVDSFMTIDQACEFLNLAKPTVYNLVHNRRIPFAKKGKRLYFTKDDLTTWITEGRKLTVREIEQGV